MKNSSVDDNCITVIDALDTLGALDNNCIAITDVVNVYLIYL